MEAQNRNGLSPDGAAPLALVPKFTISRVTGNTRTQIVPLQSLKELATEILASTWTGGTFKQNHRSLENFESAQLIGLDIDGGCSLEDAKQKFSPYKHVIATTKSHGKEKNGVTCDRFRVVLVLARKIETAKDFRATYEALRGQFPFIDSACSDASRQFFACTQTISVQDTGLDIPVIEALGSLVGTTSAVPVLTGSRGNISNKTNRFILSGGSDSKDPWHKQFVAAVYDLKKKRFTQEECVSMLAKVTGHLDEEHDLFHIRDIYNNRLVEFEQPTGNRERDIDWIRAEFNTRALRATFSGQLFEGDKMTEEKDLADALMVAASEQKVRVNTDLLRPAIRQFMRSERDRHLKGARLRLSGYDPASEKVLRDFVIAITGADENADLRCALIRHFIWQVKRKVFGEPVELQIFLILQNELEGSGKSTAIKLLMGPMNEFVSTQRFTDALHEEKKSRIFIDHFIVFFDDMSHLEPKDVAAFRGLVTGDVVEYRPMGSNNNVKGPNNSTLIGTSNPRVKDIVPSSQSPRRLFELRALHPCDWSTLNAIDYDLLWRCVSENESSAPVKQYWDRIREIQGNELRSPGPVESWLLEDSEYGLHDISAMDRPPVSLIPRLELWGAYNEAHKAAPLSETKFGIELKKVPGITFKEFDKRLHYGVIRKVRQDF